MFVTSETDWNALVMNQPESERLDFKKNMTPKRDEIALDVAAFANADGGVLAYGACEEERNGVRVATVTEDIGRTEPLVTRVEDAVHTHLHGLEPKHSCIPLVLAGGHRVLAVNIQPSLRLVGFFTPAERERVRYPVRVGTDRRYLRPDDVERRILSYRDRNTRLRITELLNPQELETPVYLMSLVHMANRGRGGEPTPWSKTRVSIVTLEPSGVRLRFGVDNQAPQFVVPYDWIVTVWDYSDLKEPVVRRHVGLLVAATMTIETGRAGQAVVGIPMPWPR